MTPLSDALTAAQRSALAALEKAYVAGQLEPEQFAEKLAAAGITDTLDLVFLLCALDVLREWGVSAPTMSERVEPASLKQLEFIGKLCEDKGVNGPDQDLTKAQASLVIDQLQKGTYRVEDWRVPF